MSKVTTIKSKPPLNCPHCNLVPAADHMGYSCPRIARVAIEDGQIIEAEYISADEYGRMIRDFKAKAADE